MNEDRRAESRHEVKRRVLSESLRSAAETLRGTQAVVSEEIHDRGPTSPKSSAAELVKIGPASTTLFDPNGVGVRLGDVPGHGFRSVISDLEGFVAAAIESHPLAADVLTPSSFAADMDVKKPDHGAWKQLKAAMGFGSTPRAAHMLTAPLPVEISDEGGDGGQWWYPADTAASFLTLLADEFESWPVNQDHPLTSETRASGTNAGHAMRDLDAMGEVAEMWEAAALAGIANATPENEADRAVRANMAIVKHTRDVLSQANQEVNRLWESAQVASEVGHGRF